MNTDRGNSPFTPVNEDHSIERVSFALSFRQAFHPVAIAAIESAHDQWRDGLPASTGLMDLVRDGKAGMPGIVFSFLRPDGNPTWSMEIARNEIRIDCFLYTRWEKVWSAAANYFSRALTAIPENYRAIELLHVEMLVHDGFLVPKDNFDIRQLLKGEEYFASKLLNAGPFWHCNVGWFADSENYEHILHNLNMASRGYGKGSSHVRVDIEHKQVCNLKEIQSLDGLIVNGFYDINAAMTELHVGNKGLLFDLLNDNVQKMISLKGGS